MNREPIRTDELEQLRAEALQLVTEVREAEAQLAAMPDPGNPVFEGARIGFAPSQEELREAESKGEVEP